MDQYCSLPYEPYFTDTCLTRTPRCYAQFSLWLWKALIYLITWCYIFSKFNPLNTNTINMRKRTLVSCLMNRSSWIVYLADADILCQLCVVINLFYDALKTLRVTACRCFQLSCIQDRTDCRLQFKIVLASNELLHLDLVRSIRGLLRGRVKIPNLGFFVWALQKP